MYNYYWPSLGEISWFLIAFGICFLLICLGISALKPDREGDGVP